MQKANQGRSKIDTNFNKVISLELLAQKLPSINNYIQTASIRVTDKSKIQGGLEFADTMVIVMKRKHQFYQSHWFITNHTYKELFMNYLNENKDSPVSLGTFLALKPFYVRPPSDKDKEMCCCKKHLHARWSVAVLLKLCEKQEIEVPFSDYESFFKHLHADCPTDPLTYIFFFLIGIRSMQG